MADLQELYDAVLNGDAKTAVAVTREAIAENIDPLQLISGTMVPAMDEVGKRYEEEEYFVPELLLSARAMKGSLELLRPLLAERGAKPTGTVAIGTVKGDLHDIGKNLVASLLEGGGFEVIDLGADVPPETTIEAMKQAGVREQVKVLVGGAPVTQQYADDIGADGYGESASNAVAMARRMCG